MEISSKPIANPSIVYRVESDETAILFDPDENKIYAINPVSAFIWNTLDGTRTENDILRELQECCKDMPVDALTSIQEFIQELIRENLAAYGR